MVGKRRSKGSAQNSKHSTPVVSDDESSKTSPKGKKEKPPKTSAELCAKFSLVNTDDTYTDADYLNLTSYGLFVRMIRPQVQGANPKISPSHLAQLMELKWKEFKSRGSSSSPKAKQSPRAAMKKKQQKEEDDEERRREEAIQKAMAGTVSSDSDQSGAKSKTVSQENSSEDEEEESEDDEIVLPQRKRGGRSKTATPTMKVKMASFTPLRGKRTKKPVKYDVDDEASVEDDDDEEEEEEVASTSKSKRKRKEESSDYGTEEDDFPPKKRGARRKTKTPVIKPKAAKKPVKPESSDEEADSGSDADSLVDANDSQNASSADVGSSDESEEISDAASSDYDDGSRKNRGRKKKPAKQSPAHIPGERKSGRSNRGNKGQMTDREFEKMLLMSDEEDEKPKKKRKGRRSAYKKKKEHMTKAELVKGDNTGYESDHNAFCEDCGDGGDLLLCDTCRCAYHQKCAKLETIPDGTWSCPQCLEDKEEVEASDVEVDHHDVLCKFCKERGECLLCDFCNYVFHPDCLNPPLKKIPEGMWKCPYCWTLEKPLKGAVGTILTWRWDKQLKNVDEFDHTHSPEKQRKLQEEIDEEAEELGEKKPSRQFFIKYKNFSYWDCDWISELQLLVFHPAVMTQFFRRWDKDEAPSLEDGSSVKKSADKNKSDADADPYKLEENFYRYGVHPDWLTIRKIISHDGTTKNRSYLILWRDQSYDEATWEDPKILEKNLALTDEFKKHVDGYWKRRKDRLEHKRDTKPPKKALLRETLKKQPTYLDDTGGKLHPYQLEGFNWLRFSWSQNTNTILADEMGLGKTIQSITFIYSLWKEGYLQGPFLISAPLTTVANWEREFEFWAPDMYVVTYLGSKESRVLLREYEFSYKEGAFAQYKKPSRMREGHKIKFDVLLTSYEYVHMDYTTLQSIDWDMLVIDEAHRLKNQQSLYFRTLLNFSIDYKLLLTGTPLQNNLEELFNLLNFLERQKFTNMEEFLNNFQDVSKDEQVSKLHDMLAPHMLRRLKIDVMKDLPDKKELIVRVELSEMQKKFYKHILTKNYEALNVRGASNSTSLMNIMMDLRKCCNHPYLFPAASTEAPIDKRGLYEGKALTEACGKMMLLHKMLAKLKRDKHRVLIFSQMTRLLDLMEDFMSYNDYNYERIDGNISGKLRQASIDRFNSPESDAFVFLLSTKAGGLGINLATADTVIIYDMDWNPHNDIQAFSRAHRIGQKNKVMIYRFVCRSTVEERITHTAKKKIMLTELVIHRGMGSINPQEKTETLNKKDINDILKFGAEDLFAEDRDKEVHYDEKAVDALLDRSQASDSHIDDAKAVGVNEYLRSFKVASYTVKENEEEEEEEKEEEQEEELEDIDDPDYWQRVLGSSYTEHKVKLLQEEERRLRSLGKGKRVRRQVNYAEVSMAHQGEDTEGRKTRGQDRDKTYNVKDDLDVPETEQLDKIEELIPAMSDYEADNDSENDLEIESSSEEEISTKEAKKRRNRLAGRQTASPLPGRLGPPPKKQTGLKSQLPPLLAKVNGHEEVLGFTARQRRVFLDAVMRYGMPPEQGYKSQWLVRDLRMKSEQEFRAYAALFMRHMCEFIGDSQDTYSDGVPREGVSRQHILTRIGMLALIRRKVNEFESINGTYSMLEFKDYVDPKVAERKARLKAQEEARKRAEIEFSKSKEEKEEDKKPEEDVKEKEDEKEKEGESEKSDVTKESESKDEKSEDGKDQKDEKVEKDEKEDKDEKENEEEKKEKLDDKEAEKKEDDKEEPKDGEKKEQEEEKDDKDEEKKEESKEEKKETPEEKKKRVEGMMRKYFYIADGNFTELHALWTYEESFLVERKEYEVWHRRHDFWLLAGVVTHGYRHWQDILNDPRFSILNKAFKTDSEIMKMAAFLNRRFQLLEQALVIEEQLRKAVEMDGSLTTDTKVDRFKAMDEAAAMMRSLANRSAMAPPLPKQMDSLLGVMENLVGDVRKMTYTNMPATLAASKSLRPAGAQQKPGTQGAAAKRPIQID